MGELRTPAKVKIIVGILAKDTAAVEDVRSTLRQKFGPAYGNGYVPVLYLVKPDGTFYRYESLDEAHMNHLRTMLNKIKK